ncbi:4Fe-4S binding protein [Adlercreutzia sp. ZJ154]|uniref:4Fe-4S binding protein n=1 Tax=Adlercreutzia sp. ZJ154 TaxID=2709790 RepID=UPI0013EB3BFF|nr:4Fe-4S binding protein [Adlercreutzia sp. ZJ154]
MIINNIVFSPTGGTGKIAGVLCESLSDGGEIRTIDLSDPFVNESDLVLDPAGLSVISMPCFGGRVPALALERLQKIDPQGSKSIVVIAYGNRAYDDALLELKDSAEKMGFDVIAAISAITEHSIMHQYATGMPDLPEVDALKKFAEEIKEKMQAGANEPFEVPGNTPYKKAGSVPLVPKVTGNCVSCGECARACPAAAINSEDYAANKALCISCMRCIQVCPKNARSINKMMVSVAAKAIKKACMEKKDPELFL